MLHPDNEIADQLLTAASHALRSYQYHNASPELAEGIADDIDAYLARSEEHPLPPMTADQIQSALVDMGSIIRGDEGEVPWKRLRILLDHGFAVVRFPVMAQGCRTSVSITHKGTHFMDHAVFESEGSRSQN